MHGCVDADGELEPDVCGVGAALNGRSMLAPLEPDAGDEHEFCPRSRQPDAQQNRTGNWAKRPARADRIKFKASNRISKRQTSCRELP